MLSNNAAEHQGQMLCSELVIKPFPSSGVASHFHVQVITTNVMYLKESRETGSAVPSRIKRQISREPSPSFRVGVNSFTPSTAIGTVPDLDQVTQLRTDRVHCLEFASTEEIILQAVRAKVAAFSGITMDHLLCASLFPHPLRVQWTCAIRKIAEAVQYTGCERKVTQKPRIEYYYCL